MKMPILANLFVISQMAIKTAVSNSMLINNFNYIGNTLWKTKIDFF